VAIAIQTIRLVRLRMEYLQLSISTVSSIS
jgi:hypothetical protein